VSNGKVILLPHDELLAGISMCRSTIARSEEALISCAVQKVNNFLQEKDERWNQIANLFRKKATSFSCFGSDDVAVDMIELNFNELRDGFFGVLGVTLSYAEFSAWFRSLDKVCGYSD
jgi:hypothetical protein